MKMEEFRAKLGRLKAGQEPFTLVLDDPAGNSYLQVDSAAETNYRFVIEVLLFQRIVTRFQEFFYLSNFVDPIMYRIRKSEFRFFDFLALFG